MFIKDIRVDFERTSLILHFTNVRIRNSFFNRSIPGVEMSPVFPESPSLLPHSLSSKITMENESTDQAREKEEGERAFLFPTLYGQAHHKSQLN